MPGTCSLFLSPPSWASFPSPCRWGLWPLLALPSLHSLSLAYDSDPAKGASRRVGAFLMFNAFQINIITSAMFMTAMAANPLAAKLAGDAGVELTWGGWFLAALVPAIVSLIVVPLFVYMVYPPEVKETPQATQMAAEQLEEMGAMRPGEWVTLGVIVLLLRSDRNRPGMARCQRRTDSACQNSAGRCESEGTCIHSARNTCTRP